MQVHLAGATPERLLQDRIRHGIDFITPDGVTNAVALAYTTDQQAVVPYVTL